MERITGLEPIQDVPEKVLLLYQAVERLIAEGADVNNIRVSAITERAGIGKGTAYDYFDTKDELIACALVFYIKKSSEEISTALLQEKGFREQILLIMNEIENEGEKQQCFMRFVHVMTDNNECSRLVREKLTQDELGQCLPQKMFAEIIKRGRERGEIRRDVPEDYLICSIFARLMTYMLCIYTEDCFKVNPKQMRPLVYQGIMEEFGGIVQ